MYYCRTFLHPQSTQTRRRTCLPRVMGTWLSKSFRLVQHSYQILDLCTPPHPPKSLRSTPFAYPSTAHCHARDAPPLQSPLNAAFSHRGGAQLSHRLQSDRPAPSAPHLRALCPPPTTCRRAQHCHHIAANRFGHLQTSPNRPLRPHRTVSPKLTPVFPVSHERTPAVPSSLLPSSSPRPESQCAPTLTPRAEFRIRPC